MIKCRCCNKEVEESEIINSRVCKNCMCNLPKTHTIEILSEAKRLTINSCDKHGLYLTTVSHCKCPLCVETVECANPDCHNTFELRTDTYEITGRECCSHSCTLSVQGSYFRHFGGKCTNKDCQNPDLFWPSLSSKGRCRDCLDHRECINCGRKKFLTEYDICFECFDKLPAVCDKSELGSTNIRPRIYECKEHGKYISNRQVEFCPFCVTNVECCIPGCHNLVEIRTDKPRTFRECCSQECSNRLKSGITRKYFGTKCSNPDCKNPDLQWITLSYKGLCPNCIEERNLVECKVCGSKTNNKFNICDKCFEELPCINDKSTLDNFKVLYMRECEEHGKYIATSTNPNTCPLCMVWIECANKDCHKLLRFHKSRIPRLSGRETCSKHCNNLARIQRYRYFGGFCHCKTCKNPELRWVTLDQYGLCPNCNFEVKSKTGKLQGARRKALIGTIGYCTNEECPHKGELIEIGNIAGQCKDCADAQLDRVRPNLGELNKNRIGTIDYCKNLNCPDRGHKVEIANCNGYCTKCSNKHVAHMQSFTWFNKVRTNIFCEACQRITPHDEEGCKICGSEWKLKEDKEFCDSCKEETLHTINGNCTKCKNKDLMWCEKCQVYGKKSKHEDPTHTLFFKRKTRLWMINYPEEFDSTNLYSFSNLDVSGIYAIILDLDKTEQIEAGFTGLTESEKSYLKENLSSIGMIGENKLVVYIGESKDIQSRLFDHMYNMTHFTKEFLYNSEIGLEARILEEVEDQSLLKQVEAKWLTEIGSWSQGRKSLDHVLEPSKRQDLEMLKGFKVDTPFKESKILHVR